MKAKHFIILAVLAALVIACTIFIVSAKFHRQQQTAKALQNLYLYRDQLDAAVQAHIHNHKSSNGVAPTTVSLRELVSSGYFDAKDFQSLEGKDVTVSLTADDRYPQAIWIRVQMDNGHDIVEMRDGSIQMIPPLDRK